MTTYLLVLGGLSYACLAAVVILMVIQTLGHPKVMVCDCRMFQSRSLHLQTPYMLGVSISCAGVSVGDLAALAFVGGWGRLVFATWYALCSVVWYQMWKKHKRGGKHGSLAKLLAKVKVTVAGLKVIPVGGHHG